MKKHILFSVIVLLIFGCQQNQTKSSDSTLKEYFDSGSIPAAIMGHIDADGNTTWHAFGPSIWGKKDTLNADHIFRIFSMTKAIASVAALQLVEEGLIGLDDPLNELMPEMVSIPILDKKGNLNESNRPITLRQLLTHTAGFGYKFTSTRLNDFKPESWDYKDNPRLFQPGTSFQYGRNIDWVGKVIEKISGQDLETYIREHITGPLKMNSTWFNVPEALSGKIVSWGGRDSTGTINEFQRIPEKPVTQYIAGEGLFSSPSDYLKFLNCMLNYGKYEGGQILKRETVELSLIDNLPKEISLQFEKYENWIISHKGGYYGELDRFGLAWAIEANENELIRPINAVYWAGAANSYFTLDVENKIAIVFFTQYLPFNDKEAYDFYKLYEKEVYTEINSK